MTINVYTCNSYDSTNPDNLAYAFLVPPNEDFITEEMAFFYSSTAEGGNMAVVIGDNGYNSELVQFEFWLNFCYRNAIIFMDTSATSANDLVMLHNDIFIPLGAPPLIFWANYNIWSRAPTIAEIETGDGLYRLQCFDPLP